MKDLPDLALLASTGPIVADTLRAALRLTFEFRKTLAIPTAFPDPPLEWSEPYARLAASDELPWRTLTDVASAVRAFLDPALDDTPLSEWTSGDWRWRA